MHSLVFTHDELKRNGWYHVRERCVGALAWPLCLQDVTVIVERFTKDVEVGMLGLPPLVVSLFFV